MSLYNNYRPQKLSEIIGQSAAKATVQGMLKSNSFPHANLFCGIHGTGKTTMARIFSKAVNCENPTEDGPCCKCASCLSIESGSNSDVIELDAASNNGVADVEAVLDQIRYIPYAKKKVLILDEVHMLSAAAFAKLLKTLEEPPEHVIFILCTTESHKVPGTIHSRCVELNFKKISDQEIYHNLETICQKENFAYEGGALLQITRAANGSVRDSLSILEALALGNQLTEEAATKRLGFASDDTLFQLLFAIACENIVLTMETVNEILENGVNIPRILKELIDILIAVISYHGGINKTSDVDITDLANVISVEDANAYIYAFTEILKDGKSTGLEMAFHLKCIQLVSEKRDLSLMEKRICVLEKEIHVLKEMRPVVSNTAEPAVTLANEASEVPTVPNEKSSVIPNVTTQNTSVQEAPVSAPGLVSAVNPASNSSEEFVSVTEDMYADIPFEMMDDVPDIRFDGTIQSPSLTGVETPVSTPVQTNTAAPVEPVAAGSTTVETKKPNSISIPVPGGHINTLLPNANPKLIELLGNKQATEQAIVQASPEPADPVPSPVLAGETVNSTSAPKTPSEPVSEPVKQPVNPMDGFGSFGNFFPSFARQS